MFCVVSLHTGETLFESRDRYNSAAFYFIERGASRAVALYENGDRIRPTTKEVFGECATRVAVDGRVVLSILGPDEEFNFDVSPQAKVYNLHLDSMERLGVMPLPVEPEKSREPFHGTIPADDIECWVWGSVAKGREFSEIVKAIRVKIDRGLTQAEALAVCGWFSEACAKLSLDK